MRVAKKRRDAARGRGAERVRPGRPARLRVPIHLRQDVRWKCGGDWCARDGAFVPGQDPGTWHAHHRQRHVVGGAAGADGDHGARRRDERAWRAADQASAGDAQLAMGERQNVALAGAREHERRIWRDLLEAAHQVESGVAPPLAIGGLPIRDHDCCRAAPLPSHRSSR